MSLKPDCILSPVEFRICAMPTYLYEVLDENGQPIDRFECEQRMSDEPLTRHPETGQPVRRVFLPPGIVGRKSTNPEKTLKDDSKLEKLGFTKYVKTGDGTYEKTAGVGPKKLNRDKH